jgi:hypothetical protein
MVPFHLALSRVGKPHPNGGATLAARLGTDDLEALQKEVEGVARSLTIAKKMEDRK